MLPFWKNKPSETDDLTIVAKNIYQIITLLGIDLEQLKEPRLFTHLYDVFRLLPEESKRVFYDYQQAQYAMKDIENYMENNNSITGEKMAIPEEDLVEIAHQIMDNIDCNVDYNSTLSYYVEKWREENESCSTMS